IVDNCLVGENSMDNQNNSSTHLKAGRDTNINGDVLGGNKVTNNYIVSPSDKKKEKRRTKKEQLRIIRNWPKSDRTESLRGYILPGENLRDLNLEEADLIEAKLSRADLRG